MRINFALDFFVNKGTMCEWNLNLKYDFRPFEEDKNFPDLLNNFRQNFSIARKKYHGVGFLIVM
mgnify:CR=1 FL=1